MQSLNISKHLLRQSHSYSSTTFLFRGNTSFSKCTGWPTMTTRMLRGTRMIKTGKRYISSTPKFRVSTKDMTIEEFKGLKVERDRLMSDIHDTCEWGKGEVWGGSEKSIEDKKGADRLLNNRAPTETGMSRLSLSDTDKQARDWFAKTTEALGCTVTVDSMGNQFAVRPGLKDGPPTFAGSHLDTQPTGGRYDGILGVTAGVEMLRVLNDHDIQTLYPVGVVNWTNEEGARFPISMVASGVWAGEIPLSHAHQLQEVGGGTATMKTELKRIGYMGEVPCSHENMPMAAHFELHIEQGPILEAEKRKIGIVQGVQAYKWFTVTVKGRDCHTGTTSFAHRADAMLAASKMILYSHRAATAKGALASTGILTLKPGSTNTVPGTVTFSLDIRAPKDDIVEDVESACKKAFSALASGEDIDGLNQNCTPSNRHCTVDWRTDSISPAIQFHPDCISSVTSAAETLFGVEKVDALTKLMTSGAGHDSVYTSKRVPTSMVFVPSRDGVSHNPTEFTAPEDCALGAQVLMGAVLGFDRSRED